LKFAVTLTKRLPETLAALHQGWIEEFKAQLIADAVKDLSDEHARAVESLVLGKAGQQTPNQLRNTLANAVMAIDPQGAEERRKERVRGRRVELQNTEPGMAMLSIHHTAEQLTAIHTYIGDRARELKGLGGETRTLEQLEADIAVELLVGAGNTAAERVVEVHLTVSASTAAGEDDQPAEVDGIPVTAQVARDLMVEASRWRWLRTDPETGEVVDLTSPRHEPPESLKTYVKLRDRTCRFPGCTRRARRCDVDHRVPWPLGPTCDENCHCLCRRHHRAKHEGGWQVRPLKPGTFEWTSPLGFTHVVKPDPVTQPQPPPTADPDPKPPPDPNPSSDPDLPPF
jgi:Domain of unknown function (DUF222)